MEKVVHLPLYGRLAFEGEKLAWDLFQTEQMSRLRDISLSSVPSRCIPHSQAASRFQHSVGVAHLATCAVDAEPALRPWRDELIAAALLHDVASTPMSHVSEAFLWDRFGVGHEQRTAALLTGDTDLAQQLLRHGVNADAVVALITGSAHPAGPIIAGSLDLDNADNSITCLLSFDASAPGYDPRRVARSFRLIDGELHVHSDALPDLLGWMQTRIRLYRLLQSEPNLATSTQLYRALEFAAAADSLPDAFFDWEEGRALEFLRAEGPAETKALLDALLHWRHAPLALEILDGPEQELVAPACGSWRARKDLCDALAATLDVRPEHVSLYVGFERGAKAITRPFCGPEAEVCQKLFSTSTTRHRTAVFLHPAALQSLGAGVGDRPQALADAFTQTVAAWEPPDVAVSAHAFF